MGDHPGAEHVGGVFNCVIRRGSELDATGFAAASGMDLGFDDYGATEFIGGCG